MNALLVALMLTLPNAGQGRVSSCTDGASWTVNVSLVDGVGLSSYGTDWTLLIGYRDDEVIDGNQPNWWDVAGRDSIDAALAAIGRPPYHDPKWITEGGSLMTWRDLTLLGAAPEAVSGQTITVSLPLAAPSLDGIDVWAVGTDGSHIPLCQFWGPTYLCPGANSRGGGVKSNGGVKKAGVKAQRSTFGKVQTIYR